MLSLPCKMYGLEKEDSLGQKFPEKQWNLRVDQKKKKKPVKQTFTLVPSIATSIPYGKSTVYIPKSTVGNH